MPKQIARQTPYMRRYARALTGDQAAGDLLVQDTLESLLAGSVTLIDGLTLRVALYRVLHHIWGQSLDPSSSGKSWVIGADQHLQTLAPDQRSILLLTAMEGFSPHEIGLVLDRSEREVLLDLERAREGLARAIATRVMIIEDEPIIALDLTRLVRDLGHDVVGTAATHAEAVALAKTTEPGLVLADIRLADGSSGMEAAAEILQGFDIPVIFITAFPEHLLTGDRPEPAFLITKPFREEAVKAMIAQALFFHAPAVQLASA